MTKEFEQKIDEIKKKLGNIEAVFDLPEKQKKIDSLEKKSGAPDFWLNPEKAGKITKELEYTKKEIEAISEMKKKIFDLTEISKISSEENDVAEIEKETELLEKEIDRLEFKTLMNGKYDRYDAILSISSGAGGVDAQDWAEMLLRMYMRWGEKNGHSVKIADVGRGQEAGIKHATIEISGLYTYGWLKSEAGVHRLVRLSPFNADNLRQTSFALVEVMPVIEDAAEVDINPKDIKMDTFRSSGAGGQSVNKTSSAVRLTHIPSGIVASCQNERSQMQNREQALKILRSKLHQKIMEEKEKEKAKLKGESISAEWGSQIRSYVIHPYKMIKDHRTKYESSDPDSVLNGNLETFMESYLKHLKK